jgi:ADP-heptose:LPS heptosyltransferase
VFRFDRIGDMIITTPFLSDLRRGYPFAEIEVLCSRVNCSVLKYNPNVNGCITFPGGLSGLMILLKLRNTYDLVVDLNHSIVWRDLIKIRILNPVWAASVHKPGKYGVAGSRLSIYACMAEPPNPTHSQLSFRYSELAGALQITASVPGAYEIFLPAGARAEVLSRNQLNAESRYWVVNQHGGRRQMSLRPNDIRKVLRHLLERDGEALVVWATTPQTYPAVLEASRLWFKDHGRVIVYRPTNEFLDMAPLLAGALGVVSPDTSIVHLAAAYDIPSVVVYANNLELYAMWRPLSEAWHRPVFSASTDSLAGYRTEELIRAVDDMIRRRISMPS